MTLYHFRDNHKNEVDLVLEKTDGKILGIEIKASSTVSAKDFNGLLKLAKFATSRMTRGFLFYTGQELLPFRIEGNIFYAIPIGLFLGAKIDVNLKKEAVISTLKIMD